MKKYLLYLGLMILSVTLFAQPDYQRNANRFITQGNYEQARLNLEAHKAFLDSKKTNKNSDEYIALEKKLYRVGRCKELQITARNAEDGYTYAYCDSIVSSAENAEAASQAVSNIAANLNRASGCYGEICNTFPSDTVSANKKETCLAILEFISNIDFQELEYWRNIMDRNTVEAYQTFIREYPRSARVRLAKSKIRDIEDNALWQVYLASKTYENCKAYLTSFPDGIYASQASESLVELEENWLWNSAVTRDDFRDYQKKYPKGRYVSQVNDKIAYIDETELWNDAKTANDISSYNIYLKKYPSGYYSRSAKTQINKIKDKQNWDKAVGQNTRTAYETYLSESSLLAYESEAREKITEFLQQERIAADLAKWESIKNSNSWHYFYKYINDKSDYRDENHLKEANYKYNIYRAKELYDLSSSNEVIIGYLEKAKQYGDLSDEFNMIYNDCNEKMLYDNFIKDPSDITAEAYMSQYSSRLSEVKHIMCKRIADSMNLFSSLEEVRDHALKYAVNPKDIDYVEDKYQSIKKQSEKLAKKRQLQSLSSSKKVSSSGRTRNRSVSREPVHFILGADMSSISDGEMFMISPLFSIGGHRNLLNLELGYSFNMGYVTDQDLGLISSGIVVRPRLNFVKAKSGGFYMYAAPEAYVNIQTKENFFVGNHYGARLGIGFAPLDCYVGYSINQRITYVGVSIYLSRN